MGITRLKKKGWALANDEDLAEAGEQFNIVVVNSGVDIGQDISSWFDTSLPTNNLTKVEKENQKKFLVEIAKRYRTLAKMSRIRVAVKIIVTLSLGYFDILTDLLVAKSYYDADKFYTAYATMGFAFFSIVSQALLTYFMYAKKVRGVGKDSFWKL